MWVFLAYYGIIEQFFRKCELYFILQKLVLIGKLLCSIQKTCELDF